MERTLYFFRINNNIDLESILFMVPIPTNSLYFIIYITEYNEII